MIRGFFIGESPFVTARVRLVDVDPELTTDVDLLIDTGSNITVLQHEVLQALGATARIADLPRKSGEGFGGRANLVSLHAGLSFTGYESMFVFDTAAALAPSPAGELPSVLGMDFISGFRLTVSRRDNVVQLEPLF